MEVLNMAITLIPIDPTDPEVKFTGSDGLHVANFVPPNGLWTLGDFETDFPPKLLFGRIAAIIRQPGEPAVVEPPEPPEPPFPGDPEAIIEVNNAWEVDVRWELTGTARCFIAGVWRVKLYLESLGDDALDREARYPFDIPFDARTDTYHAQFKIRPNLLQVEAEEGSPFQLTAAVIFLVRCGPDQPLVPGPIIGKVNLPLIQAFTEVVPSPVP
jgi:hypothetical protein